MTKPLTNDRDEFNAPSPRDEDENFGGAVSSSVALLASRAALMGFSVLANLLAARVLGPGGRGQVAAALQVSYLFSFLVVMGLDRSLAMVAPAAAVGDSWSVAKAAMKRRSTVMAFLGVIVSAVGFAIDEPRIWTFAFAVGLMAVFNGHFRVIESALINADRAKVMVPIQVLSGATTLVLLGGLAIVSTTVVGIWFAAYVASSIVVVLVANRKLLRLDGASLTGQPPTVDRRVWSRAGLRLLPASMAGFATLRSDRLLLPLLSGSEELGLYVVAATFVDLASVPVESLANVLLPRWRSRKLLSLIHI